MVQVVPRWAKYLKRLSPEGWSVKRRLTFSARGYTDLVSDAEENQVKFQVTIDRDEDGIWVVECPSIPGCVSQGETKEAALENVKEAIGLCLEVRAERGLPLTIETRQIEVLV
jgi:predicted RNase H-like HicB family nuclease